MSLREYQRKRDFKRTPEPAGRRKKTASGRQFVIQKHDASRLHYDFRLELDGTLKSWAVPKGPSLDPTVKALAVQVEDHPLDYAGFEGVIPEGEYGGGTVMVWDRGQWEPEGDAAAMFRSGKLKFTLDGKKLHGSWALVRMGGAAGEGGKNWLLIKHRDDAARPATKYNVVQKEPLSVLTGRDLPEIAADADRVWSSRGNGKQKTVAVKTGAKTRTTKAKSAKQKAVKKASTSTRAAKRPRQRKAKKTPKASKKSAKPGLALEVAKLAGARKAPLPRQFRPQLATLAAGVPTGEGWLHELKFDGYRILAFVRNGRVNLISRNGKDWTRRFPRIAAAVAELPLSAGILDGEIVSLNDQGISDFQRLQNALKRGDDQSLVYYVFDLPHADGYDLTAVPLVERKQPLKKLLVAVNRRNGGPVRYSDHVPGQGDAVLDQACRAGMEGIIAKRADAAYVQARTPSWLKVKCTRRQEFVIAGFTKPSGARIGLGALLLGYHKNGKFTYAGRVGTGFTDQSLRDLTKALNARRVDAAPFDAPLTTAQRRGVTWVRPELVGEVEFTEWTDEGLLRHPSFQGLREDKPAKQITREEAVAMSRASRTKSKSNGPVSRRVSTRRNGAVAAATRAASPNGAATIAGVALTHPDRVLYPEIGLTKQGLAEYYEAVADWILPHVVDRPLTLVRCPGGRNGPCFYQKHLGDAMPDSMRGVKIKEKSGTDEYVVIDDLAGLVSLVQMGVLEIHPWPARADRVEAPDRLIFDFDPGEGVEYKAVVDAARETRDLLAEVGLESFLRTSGGKGLHVVAPLARRNTWDQLKAFAKAVADCLVRRAPDRYIATLSKAKRRGKIFVDYLRNQRGATAIVSYATRAREGAPVAAPLAWDELSTRVKPNAFTVANMPRRLAKLKADPWKGFFDARQSITREMERALAAGEARA